MNTESKSSQISLLYRFCAQTLRYPEPDWFNEEFLGSLYFLLESLEATEEKERLERAFQNGANTIEELQVEYTRLFINGIPHVAAPPYGSVYINKSLQGQFAEKTLTFYRDHGFDLKDTSELPDHIVYQLEFLSLLAGADDKQAESEFLNTLFLTWFPDFKKRVEDEACHPFYPVIVQLIAFFTMEEYEHGI